MPRHGLIPAYLDELRARRAEAVDELPDGLTGTYNHDRAREPACDDTARAAIKEFDSIGDLHPLRSLPHVR